MQMNSKGQKELEQRKAYSIFLIFSFLKTNLQTKNHKGKNKQKQNQKQIKSKVLEQSNKSVLKLLMLKYNLITIYSNDTATS
jgi:hypothetical protein